MMNWLGTNVLIVENKWVKPSLLRENYSTILDLTLLSENVERNMGTVEKYRGWQSREFYNTKLHKVIVCRKTRLN